MRTDPIRRLPDFEKRVRQAEARARWMYGDREVAGVILAAFLDPDQDAEALTREKDL